MPVRLSHVTGEGRRATVTVPMPNSDAAEAITFAYLPNRFTPKLEAEFRAMADERIDALTFARRLGRVLVGWDVVDEADDPVELTPEVIADLPTPLIADVMAAIGQDLGNRRGGGRSDATS